VSTDADDVRDGDGSACVILTVKIGTEATNVNGTTENGNGERGRDVE
jgi:hypothetical protein